MRNVLRIAVPVAACLSASLLAGCMLDDSARIDRQRKANAAREREEQMEENLHRLEATCQGLERALDEARDESALDRQRLALLAQEVNDLKSAPKAVKPETRKKPEIGPGLAAAKNKTNKKGSDTADLLRIQTALGRAGYDPGPADGKMGAKTRKALELFQKENGLKPDGVVGARTLAKLQPFLVEEATPEAAPEPFPGE